MSDLSQFRAAEIAERQAAIDEGTLQLTRSQARRLLAERIGDDAPREGVAIFRQVDKAVIIAVQLPHTTTLQTEQSLDEMELLLDTAGGETVGRIIQRRDKLDVATFIGRGKVGELRDLLKATDADAAVFDDNLSPAQQRNLEERLGVKVLDRTIVIMDIFAQHASSNEGVAQVELAQLTYLLPRLRGWGAALSKQGGGIGTRGPGETQLEVDRRKLQRRIQKLKADLKDYSVIRSTKTKQRRQRNVPTVALVGYTNAGKSTVMRAMTGADVLVADQLFATLDTTARQLELPDGRVPVLTDTVGFVKKLPTQLVEAFRSTLDDTIHGDLLLHVVDASSEEAMSHVKAVEEVLEEIGATGQQRIIVLNKADIADPNHLETLRKDLGTANHLVCVISAVTSQGIPELIKVIAHNLPPYRRTVEALIPWAQSELVALAYDQGEVLEREDREEGTYLMAHLTRQSAHRLMPYAMSDPWADEVDD